MTCPRSLIQSELSCSGCYVRDSRREMKRSRFSQGQIVRVLKEAEAGVLRKERCDRVGISDATVRHWMAKYRSPT